MVRSGCKNTEEYRQKKNKKNTQKQKKTHKTKKKEPNKKRIINPFIEFFL